MTGQDGYDRDLIGYGRTPPAVQWPGGARVAVQFVLNYEEGGENCVLHGDPASETFLSEIVGAAPFKGARHMSMESIYEYGSRAGVWRILNLFRDRQIPLTVFAVAMALERHPEVADEVLKDGHEICSHGYRWINYHGMSEELEREHMARAIEIQPAPDRRRAAARLVHRPDQRQYPPAGRRGGRIRLRLRRLFRRPALLEPGGASAASGRTVHPG